MSGERIRVVRASDMLVCELELVGIDVVAAPPGRELRATPGAGTQRLVLHLPPQHLAEAVAGEREHVALFATVEARGRSFTRAAGPSRVAFEVPPSALPAPYRLEAILELLRTCTLNVPASARTDPGPDASLLASWLYWRDPPGLAEPAADETALELPFRLILAPDERAGFHHAGAPVTAPGSTRTELWHSRLGVSPAHEGGEEDAPRRTVRAIWMRRGNGPPWSPTNPAWGTGPQGDDEPFPVNAMSQRNRHDIVHLSGNRRYALQAPRPFYADPVTVRRLGLSSLGAWLNAHGAWDPPTSVTPLLGWTHRATQGRDHYVRIDIAGFLYPFCHRAVKVTITERKFVEGGADLAALRQRTFIVVRQPVRQYPPGAAPRGQAFTMPLQTLELKTLITPDLTIPAGDPADFPITPLGSPDPFLFHFTGTDWDGNTVELVSPLVWVRADRAWDAATITNAKSLYDTAKGHELAVAGSRIALAPGNGGDTTQAAETLVFTAPPSSPMPAPTNDQPGFWPELVRADLHLPSLEIVAGQGSATSVRYHQSYRDNSLGGANRGEVIAELAGGAPLQLGFGGKGDRAGGLIQPSMAVAGISRRLGPVGGAGAVTEVAAGTFDPKNFFAGALSDAHLFGVFTLEQVLARITGSAPSDTPRIVAEGDAKALVGRIEWNPVLQSFPPSDSKFVVDGNTRMNVTATIDARGGSARSDVKATLSGFELHLIPPARFIELAFDELTFSAEAGHKPDVDVKLRTIRFVGPLSFVEELKKLIPLDGFSDPPALEVTPAGITSSFSLAVPSIGVGVFSLENISLGAGFAIPFVEGPLTVSFNFCKREQPFLLAVALFGGGGFAGLSIDPNGVQMLEAALEFGAVCAIDLGVAQGGVHVMAGIYFKIESGKGVTLTGYFRLGGNMSVLGIISCSIEINLSFTYQGPDPGKAVGRATITVEIDIFMFSMSVEVACERKFAGSADDPSFRDLMGPQLDPDPAKTIRPWHTYCGAYA